MRLESANLCHRTVGRLLEITVGGYRTPADLDAMSAAMKQALGGLRGDERVIIVADWRHCTILGPDIAERVTMMLLAANPHALRSGILLTPSSPTAVMQMMRLIAEANFPERRVFTSAKHQIRWLAEITTTEELQRLQSFLQQRKAIGAE